MDATAWWAAIAAGDEAAVRAALHAQPGLARECNADGIRPLLWALYHRQSAMAGLLAEAAPMLDVFELAALGRAQKLQHLLAAQPEQVNDWSRDGFQPLHLAAFFGHEAAVDVLLAAGANAAQPARHPAGMHPLHSAAAARSPAIIKGLLAAGADPNAQQQGGFTALMSAAMHGDMAMVDALIAAGADPALAAADGRRAADFAAQAGHEELAQRLQFGPPA